MIFTGGYYSKTNEFSNQTFIVDLKTNKITKKADMLGPRSNHGICRVKDMIFCAGGNTRLDILKSCEFYRSNLDIW